MLFDIADPKPSYNGSVSGFQAPTCLPRLASVNAENVPPLMSNTPLSLSTPFDMADLKLSHSGSVSGFNPNLSPPPRVCERPAPYKQPHHPPPPSTQSRPKVEPLPLGFRDTSGKEPGMT
jgi:hypothetical protein